MLDTGASISCIGSDLDREDFAKFSNFTKCKSYVKTADGKAQQVIGWLTVEVNFRDTFRELNIFIIPTISHRLILGIDFWKQFGLIPNIVESVDIVDKSIFKSHTPDVSELVNSPSGCNEKSNRKDPDNHRYKLTPSQEQQLNVVISLFLNFENQGLGRTSLIKHEIDIGGAKPTKQHFYVVSPAVENLIFTEIDRMLKLGVIEPSTSPWSSPMRLVLEPNKVKLGNQKRCLPITVDRRHFFSFTQSQRHNKTRFKRCILASRVSRTVEDIDSLYCTW